MSQEEDNKLLEDVEANVKGKSKRASNKRGFIYMLEKVLAVMDDSETPSITDSSTASSLEEPSSSETQPSSPERWIRCEACQSKLQHSLPEPQPSLPEPQPSLPEPQPSTSNQTPNIPEHNPNSSRSIKCEVCHSKFANLKNLKSHQTECENKKMCCVCRQQFIDVDSLNEHTEQFARELKCCMCERKGDESDANKFCSHSYQCKRQSQISSSSSSSQ